MQTLPQTFNINILNTPSVPDTGGMIGVQTQFFLSPIVIALIALSLVSILFIAAHLLARNGKTTAKKTIHRITTISLILLPLLTVSTLTILFNNAPDTLATSNLSSVTPTVDVNIYKDTMTGPATKTVNSTTIVTTNNATGYTLSAKLNQNPTDNITITLNDEILTTNSVNIYADDTGTSPSIYDHTLAVTVPSDIAIGTYVYNIIYDITENSIACASGSTFKGNVGNMQNLNTTSWSIGDTGIATDTRNNQEYCIGKLADNNTWMLDNLKLELTDGMILTPANTNVDTSKTIYFTQDGTSAGTSLAGMTGNFTTSGYNTRDGSISSTSPNYDAWRQNDPNDPVMSGSTNCINNTSTDFNDGNVSYNTNSKTGCGYLYNFYTATAGSAAQVEYSSGKGLGYIAQQSVCPSGWKLPSGQSANGDFGKLDLAYQPGGTGVGHNLASPDTQMLWLPAGAWQGAFSGGYYSGLGGQGSYGFYWSSSVYSVDYAYVTFFVSNYVNSGTGDDDRSYGRAVRCLVD
ncbi:MAG: hypothetical protein LBK50_01195 [Candidatus Nomurabacteria bacterium]|jgi:uncharacterized protein (TIGR02145 family)|nr:hypothetical protein [Candidatus Nomurabacteria bacterium]